MIEINTNVKAYYFSREDCKLRYDDGRLIEDGVVHTVEGEPVLCEHGLHASLDPFDAFQYAPGPILWEVQLSGTVVKGSDKCVATERTYIKHIDATELLREFARKCALDVVHLWDAPDVVIQYLKTGDESLRDAARDAARAAARAAAWDVAWDAAWGAARDAAWGAAWGTAQGAAKDAARAAAQAAAKTNQRQRFNQLVQKALS